MGPHPSCTCSTALCRHQTAGEGVSVMGNETENEANRTRDIPQDGITYEVHKAPGDFLQDRIFKDTGQ